jgi:hypothetical protein
MIEHKDFKFEFKQGTGVSDDGSFAGYASVFGVEDQGQDIVAKGAFTATIADLKSKNRILPMLWSHNSDEPIGGYNQLKEDDYGLYCEGKFTAGVAKGAEVKALMQANIITGLSIGFSTTDYEMNNDSGVRTLKAVKLYEISPVAFPMLDIARVTDVKALDERELEQILRKELNLSRDAAVSAVAIVKKHLQREAVGKPSAKQREAESFDDLLKTIRESRVVFAT